MIYPVSSKISVEKMVVEIVVKAVMVEVMLGFNKWITLEFFFFFEN